MIWRSRSRVGPWGEVEAPHYSGILLRAEENGKGNSCVNCHFLSKLPEGKSIQTVKEKASLFSGLTFDFEGVGDEILAVHVLGMAGVVGGVAHF